MQRITWSGVALHEGVNLGHPASHGCIRMPRDFAARLWVLTKLGVRVIIARPELRPSDFADKRLFVHMDDCAGGLDRSRAGDRETYQDRADDRRRQSHRRQVRMARRPASFPAKHASARGMQPDVQDYRRADLADGT